MAEHYVRPPITEAVVDFRLKGLADAKLTKRSADDLAAFYPSERKIRQFSIYVGEGEPSSAMPAPPVEFRRTNADSNENVIVKSQGLVVAQLAPYSTWENFIGRVRRDWSVWKERVGNQELARIGVRFLNRIDIPEIEGKRYDPADYVLVGVRAPEAIPQSGNFHAQFSGRDDERNTTVVVNVATIDPVLLKHHSLLLDIDIGLDSQIPRREDKIFEYLDQARELKNRYFEACISNMARDLFK